MNLPGINCNLDGGESDCKHINVQISIPGELFNKDNKFIYCY